MARKKAARSTQSSRAPVPPPPPSNEPLPSTSTSPAEPIPKRRKPAEGRPLPRLLAATLLAVSLLPALSLSSLTFRRLLHPLFGSVPTSFLHPYLALVTDVVLPFALSPWVSIDPTVMALSSAVLTMRATGVLEAVKEGAVAWGEKWGPVVAALPLEWTVRLGCVLAVAGPLRESLSAQMGARSGALAFGLALAFTRAAGMVADKLIESRTPPCTERKLAVSAFAMLCLVSSAYRRNFPPPTSTSSSSRRRSLTAIPIGIALVSFTLTSHDPCVPGLQLRHHLANARLADRHRLLDRAVSTTGLVTVGEVRLLSDQEGEGGWIRYLRCDHSLLGGTWIGWKRDELRDGGVEDPVEREERAAAEAESIYATFVLQEAVRFVDRGTAEKKAENDSVLIIGLGAGIAARSLARHGLAVAVVEIDPAVLSFAKRYFGLPTLTGGEHVEDARAFLKRTKGRQKYDFVIHDVFTGGAVPGALFTVDCWMDVKAVLRNDGVLAVNFAGESGSDATKLVLSSLRAVFPACRAFSDETPETERFRNMVIFCTANGTTQPTFRTAEAADALGSRHRWETLAGFASREVVLPPRRPDDASWMLNDDGGGAKRLERAQVGSAMGHWRVMNDVLGPDVWLVH